MLKCGGCGKFIGSQEGAKCGKCSGVYHRACVNIPVKASLLPTWLCPTCKSVMPRDNKASTPVRGVGAQYVDEGKATAQADNSPDVEQIHPKYAYMDVTRQLLSVVEELKEKMRVLSDNECLLRQEMTLLRVELQESKDALKAVENLEAEVKALRVELREKHDNNAFSKGDPCQSHYIEPQAVPVMKSTRSQHYKVPTIVPIQVSSEVGTRGFKDTPHNTVPASGIIQTAGTEIGAEIEGVSWTTVAKRHRVTIRGAGESDNDLQAVEELKRIHLWSLSADTTADKVTAYMAKKNPGGQQQYTVEKLQLKHDNYASFVVTVPESYFQFFMDGVNWPKNVKVNEWFRKRNARWNSSEQQRYNGESGTEHMSHTQ